MSRIFTIFKILAIFTPSGSVVRKMLMALFVVGVAIGSFFWGRQVASQTRRPDPNEIATVLAHGADATYQKRVVASLYQGRVTISREELGEYLVARLGPARIDDLINRRIIELACRNHDIYVTDAEVDAQITQDLRALSEKGISPKMFEENILKNFNKSMYEWREDNIRPRIALNKLVRARITVTNDDVRQAFDSKYGPKVDCRMIVVSKELGMRRAAEIQQIVAHSEADFQKFASEQPLEYLRVKGGRVPPIYKHFGDKNLENAAFNLKKGEVSIPIELEDHSVVIMKCDGHVEATPGVTFEQEEAKLLNEVYQYKINHMIPEVVKKLRLEAEPKIYIRNTREIDVKQEALATLRDSIPRPSARTELVLPPPGSILDDNEHTPANYVPSTPPTQTQTLPRQKLELPPAVSMPKQQMPVQAPTSILPSSPSLNGTPNLPASGGTPDFNLVPSLQNPGKQ